MRTEQLEKLETLRNASYYLDNVTRMFIEDNNQIGTYNEKMSKRLIEGLGCIQELLDNEHQRLLQKLLKS